MKAYKRRMYIKLLASLLCMAGLLLGLSSCNTKEQIPSIEENSVQETKDNFHYTLSISSSTIREEEYPIISASIEYVGEEKSYTFSCKENFVGIQLMEYNGEVVFITALSTNTQEEIFYNASFAEQIFDEVFTRNMYDHVGTGYFTLTAWFSVENDQTGQEVTNRLSLDIQMK